jgi:uracil-DNA glycosylase family 4
MEDQLQHIIDFFKGQQNLFGNRLILSDSIIENIDEIQYKTEVKDQANKVSEPVSINSLNSYNDQIKNCMLCALGSTRTNFVFGTGNPKAKLMFVGEAPGKDEDLQGEPFVGRAGQLLNKMILAIGSKREDVYIANVLKCRPPNNRDPKPDEIDKCEPYLLHQIDLIKPAVIVALGRFGGASLLKSTMSLGEMRKTQNYYNNIPLIVTYHPAALLRNPQWKRNAWEDLKKIKSYL